MKMLHRSLFVSFVALIAGFCMAQAGSIKGVVKEAPKAGKFLISTPKGNVKIVLGKASVVYKGKAVKPDALVPGTLVVIQGESKGANFEAKKIEITFLAPSKQGGAPKLSTGKVGHPK